MEQNSKALRYKSTARSGSTGKYTAPEPDSTLERKDVSAPRPYEGLRTKLILRTRARKLRNA